MQASTSHKCSAGLSMEPQFPTSLQSRHISKRPAGAGWPPPSWYCKSWLPEPPLPLFPGQPHGPLSSRWGVWAMRAWEANKPPHPTSPQPQKSTLSRGTSLRTSPRPEALRHLDMMLHSKYRYKTQKWLLFHPATRLYRDVKMGAQVSHSGCLQSDNMTKRCLETCLCDTTQEQLKLGAEDHWRCNIPSCGTSSPSDPKLNMKNVRARPASEAYLLKIRSSLMYYTSALNNIHTNKERFTFLLTVKYTPPSILLLKGEWSSPLI